MTFTASDLKQVIALSTQPSLMEDDDITIKQFQVDHMVPSLKAEGVTLRRLENAMAAVGLPEATRDQLRAAWAK